MAEKITHGRHCTCSACAREDWTNPDLAPCGMHGEVCPAMYQPWGSAGETRVMADRPEIEEARRIEDILERVIEVAGYAATTETWCLEAQTLLYDVRDLLGKQSEREKALREGLDFYARKHDEQFNKAARETLHDIYGKDGPMDSGCTSLGSKVGAPGNSRLQDPSALPEQSEEEAHGD